MIYKVWVCLEAEYDDIEADCEEEAFEIASEAAMEGGIGAIGQKWWRKMKNEV